MVEQPAVNRLVVGSNPTSGASFPNRWRVTTASVGKDKGEAIKIQAFGKVCGKHAVLTLIKIFLNLSQLEN
jgi:hypothetical protein